MGAGSVGSCGGMLVGATVSPGPGSRVPEEWGQGLAAAALPMGQEEWPDLCPSGF